MNVCFFLVLCFIILRQELKKLYDIGYEKLIVLKNLHSELRSLTATPAALGKN